MRERSSFPLARLPAFVVVLVLASKDALGCWLRWGAWAFTTETCRIRGGRLSPVDGFMECQPGPSYSRRVYLWAACGFFANNDLVWTMR